MSFDKRIQDGLDGKYSGLPNGLQRINKYIYGVQRGRYYLYGGLSGSAKTTLVDFKILNAINYAKKHNIKLYVKYYSLEIDKDTKKANLLSCHIFNKHKIVIPPQKILGLGKFRLTADELALVNSEMEYIDELMSFIDFKYESINPTGIYKELLDHFNKIGKFKKEPYTKVVIDNFGNERTFEAEKTVSYTLDDPDSYTILVIDHLALLKSENGKSVKETIDKLSEYVVYFRNICGLTAKLIQQFNQGLNSVERQKFKGVDISPQQSDFKDTTNTYADADTVIGIMNAYKMDMDECLGYNLSVLKNRFRLVKVIKNRGGYDNIAVGLLFLPEGGFFKELPPAEEMTDKLYRETAAYFGSIEEQLRKINKDVDKWYEYEDREKK